VRIARAGFALAGLAMLAYGAWLGWAVISVSTERATQVIAWFVGGPLLHDGLVAPVVGVVGLVLTRWLPAPWRAPVAVAVVVSAILTLLAIPLLWRPFGVATNPGLHDRDYGTGLLIALAVVWICALATGSVRTLRRRDA
jgi:hypothetical protein